MMPAGASATSPGQPASQSATTDMAAEYPQPYTPNTLSMKVKKGKKKLTTVGAVETLGGSGSTGTVGKSLLKSIIEEIIKNLVI